MFTYYGMALDEQNLKICRWWWVIVTEETEQTNGEATKNPENL